MASERSLFITFEGGEGAGKTTLIDKVYNTLLARGFSVLKTRAPGGTSLGEKIRALLLSHKDIPIAQEAELFLFLADRAQHVKEVILPALKKHQIVLCDRFNDSTLAYQAGGRGLDETQVRHLCKCASFNLEPHLTFYLDIDPELGLKRLACNRPPKDRIESEELLFHQKVRRTFCEIAKKEPQRFHVLDATLSSEDVWIQAMSYIDAVI